MPGALERSLTDKYFLGKYSNENNELGMFLILETTDYNQAYASMIDWEKNMIQDFSELFNMSISLSNDSFGEKKWKDIIVSNKDTRVLYGENGNEILYYVFYNKNIFLITNNVNALKEVIARLIIRNTKTI
jgi:hypothetical protein